MVEIKKYSALTTETKNRLNLIIENEFGHIPIVKQTEWAVPDWSIIHYDHDEICTFYNIVIREITIDGETFHASGINNVITPNKFRRKGLAAKLLKVTEHLIFDDFKCDLGVLFCADNLIPFYQKLNWYKVYCPVYIQQSSGQKIWESNTMILTQTEQLNPGEIQLNGAPW